MTKSLTGGCLCGAVRYRIAGPVRDVTHCHCSMCRRASGAAMVTWLSVAAKDLAWTKGAPRTFRSSAIAERGFCADCGTPLTFRYLAQPDDIGLTVASLDDPNAVEPSAHTWAGTRLSWLKLDDGLPSYTSEPDEGEDENDEA